MSSLLSLIKIEFFKSLSSIFTSKNKTKNTSIIVVGVLLGLLFIAISCIYNFLLVYLFNEEHMPVLNSVIVFAGLAGMLTFFSAINQSKSVYIGDDYDLLITLPLKKSHIIISKIFTLYLIELLFSALIMIPNGIAIIVITGNVEIMFISFLLAFMIPIVPIAVASIISLGLTLLTARFKYGNIISIILYIPVVVLMSLMGFFLRNGTGDQFSAMGNVIKWFNPSIILLEMTYSMNNYLFLVAFVASNALILAISIALLSLFFSKLHELVTSVRMKNVYVRKELKIKDEFKSLLGIEFKRLFNSRIYLLNSVMGAIMCIFAVIMTVVSTNKFNEITDPEALRIISLVMGPTMITVMMFVLTISNPSAASISMEGKTFWIVKTLPISFKKYMYVKLLPTYIIFIPAALISSTIVVIMYHTDILGIIMTYIIPILAVIFSGLLGLIFNMQHPKFKWSNEQEVTKSGLPIILTMIVGMLSSLVLGGGLIGLMFVSPILAYSVVSVLLALISFILYLYLNAVFVKKMEAMEDF